MKLYYSKASPYARKVRLAAHELGVFSQIESIIVSPLENPKELHDANPLGKIPVLILDKEATLFDSAVICCYLDSLSEEQSLIPTDKRRWTVLQGEALADGIADAALNLVMEQQRSEEQQSALWKERWLSAIDRSLTQLERKTPHFSEDITIAHLATAAALSYLVLRLPSIFSKEHYPICHHWLNRFANRPSMQATDFLT